MIRKWGVACGVALATLVGMPAAQAEPVPTARQQLDWVLDVTHRLPAAEPELRAHLAAALLAAAGGPAGIKAGPGRLGTPTPGQSPVGATGPPGDPGHREGGGF